MAGICVLGGEFLFDGAITGKDLAFSGGGIVGDGVAFLHINEQLGVRIGKYQGHPLLLEQGDGFTGGQVYFLDAITIHKVQRAIIVIKTGQTITGRGIQQFIGFSCVICLDNARVFRNAVKSVFCFSYGEDWFVENLKDLTGVSILYIQVAIHAVVGSKLDILKVVCFRIHERI